MNLLKNTRWELALFFTKYSYVPIIILNFISFFTTFYVSIVTDNYLGGFIVLITFVGILPGAYLIVYRDSLPMFKVLFFPVKKIIVRNYDYNARKSYLALSDLLQTGGINAIISHELLNDFYVAFKDKNDLLLLKLITDETQYLILAKE